MPLLFIVIFCLTIFGCQQDDRSSKPSPEESRDTTAGCYTNPNIECLFNLALVSANNIKDGRRRVLALRDIALAQSKVGNMLSARTILDQGLGQSANSRELLVAVALAQVEIGNLSEAFKIAQIIEGKGSQDRNEVLYRIALAQIEAGELPAARATLAQASIEMRTSKHPHDKLKDIALAQIKAKDFLAALETMQNYESVPVIIGVFCSVAVAQIEAGELPAARATLAQALKDAQGASKPIARIMSLLSIFVTQSKIRDQLAARTTVAEAVHIMNTELHNETEREEILQYIAVAQAQAGDFTEALRTTSSIGRYSEREREEALHRIALAQIETGELQGAFETAQKMKNQLGPFGKNKRNEVLHHLALAQVRAKDLPAAVNTAFSLRHEYFSPAKLSRRAEVLRDIVNKCIDTGEAVAIQTVLAKYSKTIYLDALSSRSSFDDMIVDKLDTDGRLRDIAIARAEARDLQGALETAHLIKRPAACVQALINIASSQIKVSELLAAQTTLTEAFSKINFPENPANRLFFLNEVVPYLLAIYVAQTKAEDPAAAQETIAKSIHIVDMIRDNQTEREGGLREIALAQAQAGDLPEALRTAHLIQDSINKPDVFRDIAGNLSMVLNFSTALEAVHRMSSFRMAHNEEQGFFMMDDPSRSWILRSLAIIQANAGNFPRALEAARLIDSPEIKIETFCSLAFTLAKNHP